MRWAKFGQGTNSYFICTPVLAVKSLDNSTSALAGSQAAQHNVSCLSCAWAALAESATTTDATSEALRTEFIFCPLWSMG